MKEFLDFERCTVLMILYKPPSVYKKRRAMQIQQEPNPSPNRATRKEKMKKENASPMQDGTAGIVHSRPSSMHIR
jgi:hypothetical protein